MMMRQGGHSAAMLFAKKGLLGGCEVPNKLGCLVRSTTPFVRNATTFAADLSDQKDKKDKTPSDQKSANANGGGGNKDEKGIMSYWGIQPPKITKPDGTEWKWNCFRVCYVTIFVFCF